MHVVKLKTAAPDLDETNEYPPGTLPSTELQAKHHRVRLWHATKEVYEGLTQTAHHSDSIHLFPGWCAACCSAPSKLSATSERLTDMATKYVMHTWIR